MGNLCEDNKKGSFQQVAQAKSSMDVKKKLLTPKQQNTEPSSDLKIVELKRNGDENTNGAQEIPSQPEQNELPQKQSLHQIERVIADPPPKKKVSLGLEDFVMYNMVGRGAFGKVFKVKKRENGKIYAMKAIEKKKIIEHKLEENTVLERNVLKQSKHPFIVELKYSFQTSAKIYFVMELVQGGEFYKILQQTEGLPEHVVKFVTAEVLLALEYLNTKLKVIYRDLKPENILLTTSGHVKLTDFGLATLKRTDGKTYTLAGTPEYLAPEIITRTGHSFEVDIWTLGVLIFEMLNGFAPFTDPNRNVPKIQQLILKNQVNYPESMSPEAKDLIQSILKTNPAERLGQKGYHELKEHPFFNAIKWEELYKMKIKSPLKDFAEKNALKQNSKKINEKPVPESPSNYNAVNIVGITYNQDNLEAETINQKLE